jgi:hypothetical protein
LSRAPGENVGTYAIDIGSLALSSNYTLTLSAGSTFEIIKAILNVIANDQYNNFGEPLPEITFAYDGFVSGDTEFSVFGLGGPDYYITSGYDVSPGNYPIVVNSQETANYIINENSNGTLYVNPFGPGTKKIKTFADCVSKLGREYEALFRWENSNSFDVNIPVGEDNNVFGDCLISGIEVIPTHFPANSTGTFTFRFDGTCEIRYVVNSWDTDQKTSSTSIANVGTGKCNKNASARIEDSTVETADVELEDELTVKNTSVMIYPNPATDRFTLTIIGEQESVRDLSLFDVQGRYHEVESSWNPYVNGFEVNISKLYRGLYLIKVNINNEDMLFRVIKE